MRLVVDATALRDLNNIGTWISRDSATAARRVLGGILQTIARLEHFPRLARPGRVTGTYEQLVAGTAYIVVFQLQEKPAAVVIVAVVHGARDR